MDTTVAYPAMNPANLRSAMTTDLSWSSSQPTELAAFPALHAEGIQVHNWADWHIPLQKTVEAYWGMQGEKDKRLYAVTDAFAQNNGQLGVSDARYVNAIKLLLLAFTPIEYSAHRGYARVSRQLGSAPIQTQTLMQSVDHLRHHQIQTHALSHFNKYFNGLHSYPTWFDQHWFLAVAKSYADDLLSAGPYEFLVAMAFGYNQIISNVLYVPFMSAAADNGDMSTASAGFSAQSDKVRHQTAGLGLIEFLIHQDAANLSTIQAWIDKWFWRSVRLSSLVAIMQDYMLPTRTQSWLNSWTTYVQKPLQPVFTAWEKLGLNAPASWDHACEQQMHVSHQTWLRLCRYSSNLTLHVWAPSPDELDWLSHQYPGTFDALYRPHLQDMAHQMATGKQAPVEPAPVLCGTCQLPVAGIDRKDANEQAQKHQGRYFCGLHCQQIFNLEPEKHSLQASWNTQAWNPLSELFDGDVGQFTGSEDQKNFDEWNGHVHST